MLCVSGRGNIPSHLSVSSSTYSFIVVDDINFILRCIVLQHFQQILYKFSCEYLTPHWTFYRASSAVYNPFTMACSKKIPNDKSFMFLEHGSQMVNK